MKTLVGLLVTVALAAASLSSVPSLGTADAGAASAPVEATECGPNGELIARLYRAYFNRAPDPGGLLYWGGVGNRYGIDAVTYAMAQSPEYQERWADTTDAEFVAGLLYHNLLGRQPDASGLQYWVNLISDVPRDSQALYWVAQPEVVARHPVIKPSWCAGFGTSRSVPGGSAVDLDWTNVPISASRTRCPALSVNANWFRVSGPRAGTPLGLAVVAGALVGGSTDRDDFGILGERIRPDGPDEDLIDEYSGVTLRHTLDYSNGSALEHHYPWQPQDAPDPNSDWRWAVAGITLMLDGKVWPGLGLASDEYTHTSTSHSFAAFKPPSTLTIGSTTGMSSLQLVKYFLDAGYTDVIELDGGGSVEMVSKGHIAVGGSDRPIPVWLGAYC